MQLRALRDWRAAAQSDAAAIKGRNSAIILATLAVHPLLHTSEGAHRAGVSRITAERLLTPMGQVRKTTGASRDWLWHTGPFRAEVLGPHGDQHLACSFRAIKIGE